MSMPDPRRHRNDDGALLPGLLGFLAALALVALAVAAVAAARDSGERRAAAADRHAGHGHLMAKGGEGSPADAAEDMRAAMTGDAVPAPGGPNDLDAIFEPPPPSPPGSKVREYDITARDEEIEVADGVFYNAWTYASGDGKGTVPGPILRAREGERIRINFTNKSTHPHTIHTHGIHPSNQDGVFELVQPGESFTYEYEATPHGLQVFHCHATPLKKHIAKGMYGTFIIDPPQDRPKAREMVMVMNGFDTDGDAENNFYTVNGKAFYYAKYPIQVKRGELVRIYLSNMTEFDAVNSFHLHGNFFTYYPVGRSDAKVFTDVVTLGQGDRGIIEVRFPHTGTYMFHAHQSEFAELGWMGFFEVSE